MTDINKDKTDTIIDLRTSIMANEIDNLGELLPKIFSTFAKDLKPKFITCLETIDDSLFDLADKADSNQQQELYFESMRLIRKTRVQILKTFFTSIKTTFSSFKENNFDYFKTEKNYNPNIKSLSLSLIDEKELDETLAKINLINKSEMAHHQNIFALEKRFSVLASGTKIKPTQIPIGPYVIVNSFAKSIKNLDLAINLKLTLYKIFDRNIMGELNDIYTQINKILANKGIIPELTYNLDNINQAGNNQAQNTNIANQQDSNEGQLYNNVNQQTHDQNYQIISQLFSQNHNAQQPNHQSAPITSNQGSIMPATNIDMGSMINALSILQTNLLNNINLKEQINKSPTEIKDDLIKQLHKLDSDSIEKRVKQQDEDTIDLVGMLFQFLVDDRNLPETIQVVLAKLQIPYLKIALEDRNLFADKTHPARVLLDKLSLASVGWTKQSDYKMLFLSKIEDITYKILEFDEYTHKKFIDLHTHFDAFLKQQKKKADVAQKRTKETTLGQDRINQAKEMSAKLLVGKMINKQMPILVRDILLGEWSNVLNLIYLRFSANSTQYKRKVNFVDKVIAYSQGSLELKINLEDITKLAKLYGEGLKLIAFNSKESIDKQHKLIKCLSAINKIDKKIDIAEIELISSEDILNLSEIKKQEHEIVNYMEEIIEPKTKTIDISKIKDESIELVKSLKKGTWLEFIQDSKTTIRAKLSWISPITGKLLFVNSRGLKVTDKTAEELAIGLQDKSIKVLKQVAIFDRALSAIASKLKKES